MNFLNNLNLNKNEIQNVVIHNVASAPVTGVSGQVIYNENLLKYWNGTKWIDPLAAENVSGIVAVANGGTGVDTLAEGEVLIGNGTDAVTTLGIDTEVTDNSTNLVTSGAVSAKIEASMAAIESMKFMGTINASGVITSSDEDLNGKVFTEVTKFTKGDTFKASENIPTTVIDIEGKRIEAGDMIIVLDNATEYAASNMSVIQGNLDGAVIGPDTATSGALCLFDGVTGKLIKVSTVTEQDLTEMIASVFTIENAENADVVLASDNEDPTVVGKDNKLSASLSDTGVTAGTYGTNTDTSITPGEKLVIPAVTVDAKGRVTEVVDQEIAIDIIGTVKRVEVTNEDLTVTSGTAEWTIAHNLGVAPIVQITEVATGDVVIADTNIVDANTVKIFINTADMAIAANTYKVVILG